MNTTKNTTKQNKAKQNKQLCDLRICAEVYKINSHNSQTRPVTKLTILLTNKIRKYQKISENIT